jgi:hypothetical protein
MPVLAQILPLWNNERPGPVHYNQADGPVGATEAVGEDQMGAGRCSSGWIESWQ